MTIHFLIKIITVEEDEYLTHDSPKFHLAQRYIEVSNMKGAGKKFNRWYDFKWFQKKI